MYNFSWVKHDTFYRCYNLLIYYYISYSSLFDRRATIFFFNSYGMEEKQLRDFSIIYFE